MFILSRNCLHIAFPRPWNCPSPWTCG